MNKNLKDTIIGLSGGFITAGIIVYGIVSYTSKNERSELGKIVLATDTKECRKLYPLYERDYSKEIIKLDKYIASGEKVEEMKDTWKNINIPSISLYTANARSDEFEECLDSKSDKVLGFFKEYNKNYKKGNTDEKNQKAVVTLVKHLIGEDIITLSKTIRSMNNKDKDNG